ncbi:hypothetical protein [Kytococcus sp. Marseille-QA3725]
MKTFGKILFFLGVLSLVLGIIGAIVAGTSFGSANDALTEKETINGATSVSMDDDESRMLLGDSSGDASECSATGGSIEAMPANADFEINGDQVLGTLTADGEGDVMVTCPGSDYALSGPGEFSDFMKLGLGALAAIIFGLLGLFLMAVGGLLWFLGRRKQKQQTYSHYSNGEYSDQFARSAPYSQQGHQAPPAPYASTDRPTYGEPVRDDRSWDRGDNTPPPPPRG